MNAYAAAANIVEEVISNIRTVFAFGGEKVEIKRYNERLLDVIKAVQRKGFSTGLGEGIARCLFFGNIALAFWYGIELMLDDRSKADKQYTPEVLIIVCFIDFILDLKSKRLPISIKFLFIRYSVV